MMKSGMYKNICEQYDVLKDLAERFAAKTELDNLRGKLYLIGTGASLNACYAAIRPFVELAGVYPVVLAATEAMSYIELFGADDFVVLVSQSGESFETKQLCAAFNKAGVRFCGITNSPASTLAKKANVVIDLGTGEEVSSATKTHTASMLALYMLADRGGNERGIAELVQAVKTSLNDIPGIIDKYRQLG